jgi:hypothetical protein
MSTELKNIIKDATSGKKEPVYLMIKVREAPKVVDLLKKDLSEGLLELRVHTSDEKLPKWFTHAYLISLANLNLKLKEIKNPDQVKELLLNPNRITHSETRSLIEKLHKDYGGIAPDNGKLFWRTENFKKKKDQFQMKMKAM